MESNRTTTGDYRNGGGRDMEQATQELLATLANGREPRIESLPENSPAAAVLKHIESIVERAVHGQIAPLKQLRGIVEDLENVQFAHLARIKAELAMMMQNGERITDAAKALQSELSEISARHAALVNAHTTG